MRFNKVLLNRLWLQNLLVNNSNQVSWRYIRWTNVKQVLNEGLQFDRTRVLLCYMNLYQSVLASWHHNNITKATMKIVLFIWNVTSKPITSVKYIRGILLLVSNWSSLVLLAVAISARKTTHMYFTMLMWDIVTSTAHHNCYWKIILVQRRSV